MSYFVLKNCSVINTVSKVYHGCNLSQQHVTWLTIVVTLTLVTLTLHLADDFIQSDLHCIQVTVFTFLSALAFPGNRTHDRGVASAMLYYLSYRKVSYFKKKVVILILCLCVCLLKKNLLFTHCVEVFIIDE